MHVFESIVAVSAPIAIGADNKAERFYLQSIQDIV